MQATGHDLKLIPPLAIVPLILIALLCNSALAAGLLKPLAGATDSALSISAHRVDVTINNGFAPTQADQTFAKTGQSV